jgi:uncharacterized protein YraI
MSRLNTCRYILLIWMAFSTLIKGVSPAAAITPTPTQSTGRVFATITVKIGENPDINVRAGPGVEYTALGKLLAGQEAPALGRSVGGDWVQISFPEAPDGLGWVYTYLVDVSGELPIVIPPATPTPHITPTIDPTLAAQFIREPVPTGLPTFTPPPPLVIPTFVAEQASEEFRGAGLVYLMIGLGIVGLFTAMLSFIRVR